MGVLNVTPDSFSDGGRYFDLGAAIERGIEMMDEGVDLIDVGGESTRPGSQPVPLEEERRRVIPTIEALLARGAAISIDTSKAALAAEAVSAGVAVVNDVTALSDPAMVEVCARANCSLCLMHMQGTPRTMQDRPCYEDVVADVRTYLLARAAVAMAAGLSKQDVWIDPGIGFGKIVEHNLELIAKLGEFVQTGHPVLIGISRKSFIGKLLGDPALPPEEREEGSLAAAVLAQAAGARAIRVHNVKAAARAVKVAAAILEHR
jgi:dihydropteroate synthase